jgi:multiple sugar transport system substrate-binding protein
MNRKNRIVPALLAFAICATLMTTACVKKSGQNAAGGSQGNTMLRWAFWGSETRVKMSQAAVDTFQAANPGIVINIEVSGGSGDHFQKVDTQLAGGAAPDIIQMGGNYPDYIAKGVPLNLDPYKGNLLDVSVIDTGAIEAGTKNGHLYAVSTGATIPALVYNKTLLQKAGAPLPKVTQTWEEFRAYLVSIKGLLPAGVYPLQDFGSTTQGSTGWGYWARDNGTETYNATTNTTQVTVADTTKFLNLFKDYRDNGLVPPASITAGYSEAAADSSSIVAGKVAIGFIVSNQFAGYQSNTTDELDLIEMPNAAVRNSLWPQLSQVYTVNSGSKNIDAAVRFINFLVNDPEAGKILGNDRGISSSSTYRAGAASVASDIDRKVFAYHDIAGPHSSPETDHLPNDTEFSSTLNLIYQNVAFGNLNTTQGGQQMYELLMRMIAK